jgi:S-adenosylmethionine:tRNA ribosyltransferase-isomerase
MREPLPVAAFDFDYPEDLIASVPAEPRDSARLLFIERRSGALEHRFFRDLPGLLKRGDCLVLNETKVFSCRLKGKKSTGGKADLLLVKELEPGLWAALASGFKKGMRLDFPGDLTGEVQKTNADGEYEIKFSRSDMRAYLERHGLTPLPPYILKRKGGSDATDVERYQTVYAQTSGSIAAPTAGLHFTPRLLEELKAAGVRIAKVTLHVGRGTFRPIQTEDARAHEMLAESYRMEACEAALVRAALEEGRRVVSVGTTSTRTLETLARQSGGFGPGSGETELYITPGHDWKAVSGLLTNFHLPRSTPLLLASAFLGREKLLAAYSEAVARRYRLYSYGDAMLIL